MNVTHAIIVKIIEEDVSSSIINLVESQLTNKRLDVVGITIFYFLLLKVIFKTMMCNKKSFCKTLVF
jgi:hypothetical protein